MLLGRGGELHLPPHTPEKHKQTFGYSQTGNQEQHPFSWGQTHAPFSFPVGLPGLVLSGHWLLVTNVGPPLPPGDPVVPDFSTQELLQGECQETAKQLRERKAANLKAFGEKDSSPGEKNPTLCPLCQPS